MLADATQCGPFSGGSSGFFRPRPISAARVMLIGDAANQADPLNGGGIHKAMESAWCAAEACRAALADGDFSAASMRRYADLWSRQWEADWRAAELFMSIAKNPSLSDFGLFVLRHMGRLSMSDPKFREFAGGIFAGIVSQDACAGGPRLSDHAFPKDRAAWPRPPARERTGGRGRDRRRDLQPHRRYLTSAARAAVSMAKDPIANMDWGLDLATKAAWLAQNRLAGRPLAGGSGHDRP